MATSSQDTAHKFTFENLEDLANFFDEKGREIAESRQGMTPTKMHAATKEAAAWLQAAQVVRHSYFKQP